MFQRLIKAKFQVAAILLALTLPIVFNQCAGTAYVSPEDLLSASASGIVVSSAKYNLTVGETAQLSVSGGIPPYTFSVAPAGAASMDTSSYLLTALVNGTTTIVATDSTGQMSLPMSLNIGAGSFLLAVDFPVAQNGATWRVPAGVTIIRVKSWGAGGGSGSIPVLGAAGLAGSGGAGGFAQADFAVTPGETLTIRVGAGGAAGSGGTGAPANIGRGGGGGGYSALYRGTTPLLIAGAGGGGVLNHS